MRELRPSRTNGGGLPLGLATAGAGLAVLSANLAAGCVGVFAPLGVAITTLGLDWLHVWDVQQPVLYSASALSLLGLGLAAGRHGRPLLLGLGVASLAALLSPLHEAMDVTAFRWLLSGGAAGLVAVTAWTGVLRYKGKTRRRWRRTDGGDAAG